MFSQKAHDMFFLLKSSPYHRVQTFDKKYLKIFPLSNNPVGMFSHWTLITGSSIDQFHLVEFPYKHLLSNTPLSHLYQTKRTQQDTTSWETTITVAITQVSKNFPITKQTKMTKFISINSNTLTTWISTWKLRNFRGKFGWNFQGTSNSEINSSNNFS